MSSLNGPTYGYSLFRRTRYGPMRATTFGGRVRPSTLFCATWSHITRLLIVYRHTAGVQPRRRYVARRPNRASVGPYPSLGASSFSEPYAGRELAMETADTPHGVVVAVFSTKIALLFESPSPSAVRTTICTTRPVRVPYFGSNKAIVAVRVPGSTITRRRPVPSSIRFHVD